MVIMMEAACTGLLLKNMVALDLLTLVISEITGELGPLVEEFYETSRNFLHNASILPPRLNSLCIIHLILLPS